MGLENAPLAYKAKKLIIKMTEKGRQMIYLTLPARFIRVISQMIPEALSEVLQKAGVDIGALEQKYTAQPIMPGSVLALAIPERDQEVLFYLI